MATLQLFQLLQSFQPLSLSIKININLIAKCLSNNRESQRQLYDVLMPYLNVICQRYLLNEADLKDVLQDTFINIFKALGQFDVEKASFKTWATRIAINCCLKKNEKHKKQATQEFIIDLHEPRISPKVLDSLSNAELIKWLKGMPAQYFEVFNMYVIDGFSHSEIAQLLKIEASLSRQRLSRARTWLKNKLPEDKRSQFDFSFN